MSILRETGPETHRYGGGGRTIMKFEDALLIRSFVEIILGKDRDNVGKRVKTTTLRLVEAEGSSISVLGKRLCCWPLPVALCQGWKRRPLHA